MYTVSDARLQQSNDLDERIEAAVKEAYGNSAYLRIYCEDRFRYKIREELENRGFVNIQVPDFILKGDVYFEW
jgi:hypothetical protein